MPAASVPRAVSPSASTTVGRPAPRRRPRPRGCRRRPRARCPARCRSRAPRSGRGRRSPARPSPRRAGRPARPRSGGRPPARPGWTAARTRRPSRAPPRPRREAAPPMPGLPATTHTALCHLWATTGRVGQPARHRGGPDEVGPRPGRRRGRCRPPRPRRPARARAGAQARLQGRERDGGVGREDPPGGLAGEPVDPGRDVDGEHQAPGGGRGGRYSPRKPVP